MVANSKYFFSVLCLTFRLIVVSLSIFLRMVFSFLVHCDVSVNGKWCDYLYVWTHFSCVFCLFILVDLIHRRALAQCSCNQIVKIYKSIPYRNASASLIAKMFFILCVCVEPKIRVTHAQHSNTSQCMSSLARSCLANCWLGLLYHCLRTRRSIVHCV